MSIALSYNFVDPYYCDNPLKDAVRETHFLRKQHYQANEQRAKVLEEKLKGLCLAMEHRKR